MRRINAPSLIELAITTLRDDVQAGATLAPGQRYALAMAINALKTARAEIISEPDAPIWQLLDNIYDDGEGSVEQLARDIRANTVSDATHPDLRQRLETLLVAELEVRNPQVLKRRAEARA